MIANCGFKWDTILILFRNYIKFRIIAEQTMLDVRVRYSVVRKKRCDRLSLEFVQFYHRLAVVAVFLREKIVSNYRVELHSIRSFHMAVLSYGSAAAVLTWGRRLQINRPRLNDREPGAKSSS